MDLALIFQVNKHLISALYIKFYIVLYLVKLYYYILYNFFKYHWILEQQRKRQKVFHKNSSLKHTSIPLYSSDKNFKDSYLMEQR